MSYQTDVLRALLRLARRRLTPTLDALVDRVGGLEADVLSALRALEQQGLVQRTRVGVGLSLAGFAVAVALADRGASASSKSAKAPKSAGSSRIAPSRRHAA